jgi:hypothetical protein
MKRDYVTSTTRENMYQNNITYRRNIDHTSFVLRGVFGVGLTGCEINEGGVIPMAVCIRLIGVYLKSHHLE